MGTATNRRPLTDEIGRLGGVIDGLANNPDAAMGEILPGQPEGLPPGPDAITDAVLHDRRSVLTVCAPAADIQGVADVTVSVPRLVGGAGVLETFTLPLGDQDATGPRASARVVRDALDELDAAG